MITILLADDHEVVRNALRRLLEDEPDFDVLAEAGDGDTALELVSTLRPDVLIVDVMMPGLNGLEVAQQINQLSIETRVVVLSMYSADAYVARALSNGALGYVLKSASTASLVRAVREAAAGERYLSPPLSEQAVEAYLERAKRTSLNPYENLTARERQVLRFIADGLTSSEIAERLHISRRTVETHRANLMHKLDLDNQAAVVRYVVEHELLS